MVMCIFLNGCLWWPSFCKSFGIFRLISVLETTAMLKIANLQYVPLVLFVRSIGSLMKTDKVDFIG